MTITELDSLYVAGTYKRFPVEIESGKGSVLYSTSGKKYIDMGSGIGVTSFGIADEIWQNAVYNQLAKVQHTSNLYYTEPCVMLAKTLCEKTGMKKVFFSNSGAEANECAIKVARKYSQDKYCKNRHIIVTLKNGFHGRTLTTLSATGQEHYHELFNPLTPGFCHIDATNPDELDQIPNKENICAIMIECVQGEGGVIPISREFAAKVQNFADQNDVLLIVDEVQTGNGRTGKMYSYMNYGLFPDIVSTAKGLGGGLPLGATILGEKVKDVLGFGDHGSTFGANPVCCAGALSVINRIDQNLLDDVKRKSKYIFDELSNTPGITAVSGMGLMIGIKTEKPVSDVVSKCINDGVLCLTAKDKLRLLPALNIPDDILAEAIQIVKNACL